MIVDEDHQGRLDAANSEARFALARLHKRLVEINDEEAIKLFFEWSIRQNRWLREIFPNIPSLEE